MSPERCLSSVKGDESTRRNYSFRVWQKSQFERWDWRVGRGASERFHCRGTSNRGIMGIVWCWISIQTASSSGPSPVRATSSALGTARTLHLTFSHPLVYIATLLPPAYWIPPSTQGFCTFESSRTFLICNLTAFVYGLGCSVPLCIATQSYLVIHFL